MMKMRTRIKELRARYDLTQDELADIVDVSRRTMLYLEKGKYNRRCSWPIKWRRRCTPR